MKIKEKVIIISIIIIYLIFSYLSVNNLNLYTPDSTRYYIWAQSLSNFEGFKDETLPEPKSYVIHAPLYSLLVAPVAIFFPNNIIALKFATIIISCLGLFLFFIILKNYLNTEIAFYGTIILLLNPLFFLLSGELLSDVPFLVLLIGIFLYFGKLNKTEYSNSEKIIFSLMITMAVLLREVGISIMIGSIIYFLYRKKYQLSLTILTITLVFYLLWLFRNEYLVASFELPDLTNSKLFSYHFFTSPDSSILTEFIARIKHNSTVYFSKIIALIFYPIYETTQFDVVLRKEGIIAEIADVLKILKIPFAIIVWGITIFGILRKNKNSELYNFINLFLIIYLLIILIYPINDIRFLLPLLVVLLIHFMNGFSNLFELIKTKSSLKFLNIVILLLAAIFLIPNLVWTGEFIYLSNCYMKSPLEFQKYSEGKKFPPSHFTKPLNLVGNWIKENSSENAIVIGMWKDLACWIEPRKLIIADFLITPAEFDYYIRDYKVEFIVSQTDRLGFNDFEVQMSQSKKYSFSLAKRIGRLNVYKINSFPDRIIAPDKTRFQQAISFLFDCKYPEAELIFDSLYTENNLNSKVIFYCGVTKSLMGKFTEAEKFFKELEEFPQAGMFINQIKLHRQIIQLTKAASMYQQQFADYTTRAAGSYWSMGYEKHAYNLLDSVLNFDSTFIPAYIFKLHFALKQNKISDARNSLNKIAILDTSNNLLEIYNNLISRSDSIKNKYSGLNLTNAYIMNAKDYYKLGVYEDAIDNLLLCLQIDKNNIEAMNLLSEIYILKRRFAPAKTYLEKIMQLNQNDYSIQEKYKSVLKYF